MSSIQTVRWKRQVEALISRSLNAAMLSIHPPVTLYHGGLVVDTLRPGSTLFATTDFREALKYALSGAKNNDDVKQVLLFRPTAPFVVAEAAEGAWVVPAPEDVGISVGAAVLHAYVREVASRRIAELRAIAAKRNSSSGVVSEYLLAVPDWGQDTAWTVKIGQVTRRDHGHLPSDPAEVSFDPIWK